MKTRLLILMSMLVAAPAAAQDDDFAAEGDVEADVSADVDTDTEVSGAGDYESDTQTEVAGAGEYEEETNVVEEVAPIAYTHRSITLPKGTLRIDLGPADRAMLQRSSGFFGMGMPTGFTVTGTPGDSLIDLHAGAAFGVIDGLEVGAVVLPLAFAPSGRDVYGNPSLYGRYRIVDGDFQLGAQVRAMIPIQDGTDFGLGVGVPVKLVVGNGMHLNTGVELGFVFADETAISLSIPLEFAVNITEALFAGLATGFTHPNFDGGDPLIPLGVFAGYTIGMGNGMLVDASVDFSFPGFLGFADGYDNPFTDVWQLTLGAVLRMDLL